jgi:Arc/MetJ-type ribon-helix-helix transcriptional regulator
MSQQGTEKITIRLPQRYLNILDFLVAVDDFPSRSEAIRTAVRDMIYARAELVPEKLKKFEDMQQKMITIESFEKNMLKK